jgi:hypothetical protein
LAQVAFDQAGNKAAYRHFEQQNVVRPNILTFLREDNLAQFLNLKAAQLPHFDLFSSVTFLRCPRILEILPSSIRVPVHVVAEATSGFSKGGVGSNNRYDIFDVMWGSCDPQREGMSWGDYRSRPLQRLKLPWLEFEVLGQMEPGLRLKNFYLRLQEPESLRETAASPIDRNNGRWGSVTIKTPCDTPRIIALDHDFVFWMAFTEPREKSTLSVWVASILKFSSYLLVVGIGLMAIAFYLMRRGVPLESGVDASARTREIRK